MLQRAEPPGFGVREVPLNPGRPDLVAASDSGKSDSDNLTNRDNGGTAQSRRLTFAVANTMPGDVLY